ncbi:gamma carbonic anhydrase family protein [Amycolatopsis jejuensis]|uniref:gamma carbonic anhydrase family protein n=1 Tax=Amycolatopsis jejuensis TaxID=330084 RepID=UPI000525B2C0|nr:gamma carbonic anhydrase family protein [Amycolatopsis jejuensis]
MNGSADRACTRVADTAYVAPGAVLFGDVTVGDRASVWYGAVIRADLDAIRIGPRSNIQDGAVLHTDPGLVLTVGAGVSVGHRAVLHGCTVADDVLVGIGAAILNGARVGAFSLVAAGTVVLENTAIPPGSLVTGVPGRVRRQLTDGERTALRHNADIYLRLSELHRDAHVTG